MRHHGLALATAAIFASVPTVAHDLWIEPSSFRPAPGSEVTAVLLVGQNLQGESLPRNPTLIDRFFLKGKGPEIPLAGEPGDDPAGFVRVSKPGLYWIGYQSHPYPIVLEAGKFEDYLRAEGLERVVETRARNGQTAAAGRERFYRCAKSLLFVAGDKASAKEPGAFDTPLGFTLELVPRKNPARLSPGDTLPVALSFHGTPVANVLVIALNKDDATHPVSARTDAQGLVTLRLVRGGFWLVKAVHMEAAPPDAGVDWESWWASITFDVRAPSKQ